jgi:hypothetical protein
MNSNTVLVQTLVSWKILPFGQEAKVSQETPLFTDSDLVTTKHFAAQST